MAWAGICKNTPDFGSVFAGMTMTANEKIRPFNHRMPVLLERQEYDRWLHGSIEDVIAFQFRDPPPSDARPFARGRVRTVLGSFDDALAFQKRTFPPELVTMERTSELWAKKKTSSETPLLL